MPGDFPKDFNLLKMDLTNAAGDTIGLRYVFIEISVYEDIWNNNVTCDVLINDANNLLMNFPIFGYETLDLQFQTPDKTIWAKTLRLIRITDRKLVRERELAYVLHFVSQPAITNLKTRVSKSYKGKLISDIVNDLHYNWLSAGDAEIEPTKFEHHVIIPKIFPVQAINWLCTRANSTSYEGANYLYFEDRDKFRFVSLESRLGQDKQVTYTFQPANVRTDAGNDGHHAIDINNDIVAVESYTFDNHSDILTNLQSGMYGNELLVHSQQRKRWDSFTFDYPSSFDDYIHLYPGNYLESTVKQDLNVPNSKLKMASDGRPNTSEFPARPESWIVPRISQLQQLQNIKLTITVPGDSDRTVGQIVEFELPSPEPPQDNQQIQEKYYKGRYLVSALRHKIDINKFVTTMELIKDSVFEAYP